MKDKTTAIVVVVCLVALFGWQKLINTIYPPQPLPEDAVVATATNLPPAQPTAPTTTPTTPAAEEILPTPAVPAAELAGPRPPEEIVVIANDQVRAEFTSWGGGIRSIELLNYRLNGEGTVVLNTTNALPALSIANLPGADATSVYAVQKIDSSTVRLSTRTAAGVEIIKTVSLGEEYHFDATVEVIHSPTTNLTVVIGTATPVEPRETPDMIGIGWLHGSKYENIGLAGGFGCGGSRTTSGSVPTAGTNARWVAVKNQFFGLLLNPVNEPTSISYAAIDLPRSPDSKDKQAPQGMQGAVDLVPSTVSGYTQQYQFAYYAGPKEYKRLVGLGDGEEELMHFGFWGIISVVLLRGMNFFHSLIPNYGVAIILITFIIKIIFWPIQAKSMKSMKAMQKFQPIMTKLREKYKDDPQKMNAEMMKLYKEHKINPFAGCLPMLVQIPVFFAFYTMLRSAIELRGASFLWIHDLSQPDTIGHLLGFPLNPLPLLMGVSMIGQMKLTPSGGDPKQQQMMMFMPLIFLFICYNMSSGLVLYWTVQQFLSIAQQWWSLRQTDETPAVTVIPPGKTK